MSTVYQAVEQDGSYTARCASFNSMLQASLFKASNPDLKLQRKTEAFWEQMEGMANTLENASEATGNLEAEENADDIFKYSELIEALDEAAAALRKAAKAQKQFEPEGKWMDL